MLQSVSKEKILITGGSGFLGSHLCRRFLHHGAEVHAVSRSKRDSDPAGLRWWQGDMADVGTVRRILYQIKPDVIFHLSGLATAVPDRELVLHGFRSICRTAGARPEDSSRPVLQSSSAAAQ